MTIFFSSFSRVPPARFKERCSIHKVHTYQLFNIMEMSVRSCVIERMSCLSTFCLIRLGSVSVWNCLFFLFRIITMPWTENNGKAAYESINISIERIKSTATWTYNLEPLSWEWNECHRFNNIKVTNMIK